jgi:peptide/nickel transport system substrate-binding protein
MDRETWSHVVYSGHADPALTIFPPASRFSDTPSAGYDLTLYMELLDTLGVADTNMTGLLDYPSGRIRRPFSLRLLVSAENPWRINLCHAIAAHMRLLGIEIVIDVRHWNGFQSALANGDYDLYLGELTLPADFNPAPLLAPDGAMLPAGYRNERLTELLEAWPLTAPDGLPDLAAELNALLYRDAPVIPLFFTRGLVRTTRGMVSGVRPVASQPFDNITAWKVRTIDNY